MRTKLFQSRIKPCRSPQDHCFNYVRWGENFEGKFARKWRDANAAADAASDAFLGSLLAKCRGVVATLKATEPEAFLCDAVYQRAVTTVQELPGLARGKVDFLQGGTPWADVERMAMRGVRQVANGVRRGAIADAKAGGDAVFICP